MMNLNRGKLALMPLAILIASGAFATEPRREVARLSSSGARLEWQPLVTSEAAVLTVSRPDGVVVRREFGPSARPTFELFDSQGKLVPDGAYSFEIHFAQPIDPAVREELLALRENRDETREAELRRTGKLPAIAVASGSFRVVNGLFVTEGAAEPPATTQKAKAPTKSTQSAGPTPNDIVQADDVIIQGSLCVGLDCVNNESFGFDTIRLKENNTRIKFQDTSTGTGFPTHDWQLTANDSASGGAEKFSIEDITAATVPFTVLGSSPTNSIFVDSTGRVGFRTSTPVLDLHVNTSNTPALRLEQNNSGGFTAQTWDVAGNEANFFVRDVTGGSRLPFRIRPGAPTSSIDINASGSVGIGTASPGAQLHVSSGATAFTTDTFAAIGPDASANGSALNFVYAGASVGRGAGVINVRNDAGATAPNPSLRLFTANVERVLISNTGNIGIGLPLSTNPTSPIQHGNGATLSVGGTWTNSSSRAFKRDIADLPAQKAMQALDGLNPVTYAYIADPNEKHVGFIAEDVPDLVATQDRKGLSPMDVTAVLTKVVKEQQKTIEELSRRIEQLEKK